jgi:hypothetical protein
VRFISFAFARILAASSLFATNRNATLRLLLTGISGLPARFTIPTFLRLLISINYGFVKWRIVMIEKVLVTDHAYAIVHDPIIPDCGGE